VTGEAAGPGVLSGPTGGVSPTLVTPGELYRLTQVQSFNNLMTVINQFHLGRDGSGGTPGALCNDWVNNVVTTWKNNVTQYAIWSQVYVQMILPYESGIYALPLTGGGTVPFGNPLPPNAAGIITWRTELAGRRRRGRTYVAGCQWNTNQTTNFATWNSGGIAALTNIANAIFTRYQLGGNPGGYYLVVWSRREWADLPAADWPQAAAYVNRYSVQPYVGTMGSRRAGRGI